MLLLDGEERVKGIGGRRKEERQKMFCFHRRSVVVWGGGP